MVSAHKLMVMFSFSLLTTSDSRSTFELLAPPAWHFARQRCQHRFGGRVYQWFAGNLQVTPRSPA
jgi:hypothetical protein